VSDHADSENVRGLTDQSTTHTRLSGDSQRSLSFHVSEAFIDGDVQEKAGPAKVSLLEWFKLKIRRRKNDDPDVYPLW
jgi:hypothetical protein